MSILDNFDVVGVPRTFSIAEVRILKNRISFNLATASEIGYPPFVRLFISRDKTQIALQPCAKETPNACTDTGLCLIPTPAYPFVEMPSGYFAS